jgi:hypothetical protein
VLEEEEVKVTRGISLRSHRLREDLLLDDGEDGERWMEVDDVGGEEWKKKRETESAFKKEKENEKEKEKEKEKMNRKKIKWR